jgi:hypothetical protein
MTTVDSLSTLFVAPPRDVELNPTTSLDAPLNKTIAAGGPDYGSGDNESTTESSSSSRDSKKVEETQNVKGLS